MTTDSTKTQGNSSRVPVELAYKGASQISQAQGEATLALVGNSLRQPVSVDATILDPVRFRECLSVLFEVVSSDYRYVPKDRTAYLAYQRMKKGTSGMAAAQAQQAYFDWLAKNDPTAWTILDPVVSAHPDELAFEVFSKDEGSYARLGINWKAFKINGKVGYGTTNVDYSQKLYDGVQRMRSYRTAKLKLGQDALSVSSAEQEVVEKKIQLPVTWLRAFLQVQSAAILASEKVEIAPIDIYNLLRHLRLNKDQKKGGRALRIELVPGEQPRLVLEPWELVLTASAEPYQGKSAQVFRIWGRRRLLMLRRMLPFVDTVSIHILGSGLPNFWTFEAGPYHLTLGLSGFTASNWSQAVSFDTLLPRSAILSAEAEAVLKVLEKDQDASLKQLAKKAKVKPAQALQGLQQGSQQGKLIYDLRAEKYRLRALTDDGLDLVKLEFRNQRDRVAHDLLAIKDAVKIVSEKTYHESGTEIVAKVAVAAENENTGHCSSSLMMVGLEKQNVLVIFFRKHKLKEGPCEHLIALRLRYAAKLAKRAQERAQRKKVTVEARTYVRREKSKELVYWLSLDHKRLKIRWGTRGQTPRIQSLVFNENGQAREAYFERVDALESRGFLDASAS